jgi:hypothetical protein
LLEELCCDLYPKCITEGRFEFLDLLVLDDGGLPPCLWEYGLLFVNILHGQAVVVIAAAVLLAAMGVATVVRGGLVFFDQGCLSILFN